MTNWFRKLRTGSCLVALAAAGCACAAAKDSEPVITAYVFPQNVALGPGDVDAHALTRINYAFANIANGRIVEGFAHDAENYATLTALRKQNPSLKVLVSVGGWEWSTDFSDAVLTADSRKVFLDSVMEFIHKYDLDGLDIDWEYPGQVGAHNKFRPEDKHNFTLVLAELRKRFKAEEKKTHRHYYITIAAGSDKDFVDHTEMKEVGKQVDDVNLMCYDYYEPHDGGLTGHHSPLFASPNDPKKVSSDETVKLFLAAGVPAKKLVLGVPFYGHVWGEVPATANGLYQPGKAVKGIYAPFHGIETDMLGQGYTRYWDSAASVPYLYNADKKIFVSYEDVESITGKAKYVRTHHLAGMMFWDYEGDSNGKLLHAMDEGLGLKTGQ